MDQHISRFDGSRAYPGEDEIRAYLLQKRGVNFPPLNSTDAIELGKIETYVFDTRCQNLFELHDLSSAVAHHIWNDSPAHTWHEVDFQQLAEIVGSTKLARIALLRSAGVYEQVDTETGKVKHSSAPRGIGSHRVRRIDFDGLEWDGSNFVEAPEHDEDD